MDPINNISIKVFHRFGLVVGFFLACLGAQVIRLWFQRNSKPPSLIQYIVATTFPSYHNRVGMENIHPNPTYILEARNSKPHSTAYITLSPNDDNMF